MSSGAQLQLDPNREKPAAPYAWRSLATFLVSGMLMSFLGAILPAWGYHLRSGFAEVGGYFLSLAVGLLLSVGAAHFLLRSRGLKFLLIAASALGCGAFLFLAVSSPPAPWISPADCSMNAPLSRRLRAILRVSRLWSGRGPRSHPPVRR